LRDVNCTAIAVAIAIVRKKGPQIDGIDESPVRSSMDSPAIDLVPVTYRIAKQSAR
jgi:hypothetical protein